MTNSWQFPYHKDNRETEEGDKLGLPMSCAVCHGEKFEVFFDGYGSGKMLFFCPQCLNAFEVEVKAVGKEANMSEFIKAIEPVQYQAEVTRVNNILRKSDG